MMYRNGRDSKIRRGMQSTAQEPASIQTKWGAHHGLLQRVSLPKLRTYPYSTVLVIREERKIPLSATALLTIKGR